MLRPARAEDAGAIAEIWHRGWQDGHLGFVPQELLDVRTEASFRTRASERIPDTTVATVEGAVAGFVMVVGFYERAGWVDEGHFDYPAAAEERAIAVPSRRYTKSL